MKQKAMVTVSVYSRMRCLTYLEVRGAAMVACVEEPFIHAHVVFDQLTALLRRRRVELVPIRQEGRVAQSLAIVDNRLIVLPHAMRRGKGLQLAQGADKGDLCDGAV